MAFLTITPNDYFKDLKKGFSGFLKKDFLVLLAEFSSKRFIKYKNHYEAFFINLCRKQIRNMKFIGIKETKAEVKFVKHRILGKIL